MDVTVIVGYLILAGGVAFFLWLLVTDAQALARGSNATPRNEEAAGSTAAEQPRGLEADYGPPDCFYDCMRAFRWEAKEELSCASVCGLSE
jgi:hypothetical protein